MVGDGWLVTAVRERWWLPGCATKSGVQGGNGRCCGCGGAPRVGGGGCAMGEVVLEILVFVLLLLHPKLCREGEITGGGKHRFSG